MKKRINLPRLAKKINEKTSDRYLVQLSDSDIENLKPLLTVDFNVVSSNEDLYKLRYKSNIIAIVTDEVWINRACKGVFNTIII